MVITESHHKTDTAAVQHHAYGRPLSDKSKLVAGLLQLFLASTVFTLGLAGWIWPLIDAILMFTGKVTDAEGRILRD
jgi:hypothetical protein